MTLKEMWASGDKQEKRAVKAVVLFWVGVLLLFALPTWISLPIIVWVCKALIGLVCIGGVSFIIYNIVVSIGS